MKEIGGYFELELPYVAEYHKGALRLNTGRNAFEYVLRAKGYKNVYLPYYTCDLMLEPIRKLNISFEFYSIDEHFYPNFDFEKIGTDEVFVYTNYFGICDRQVEDIHPRIKNLVVDNSQAFYSYPILGVDTFYSPRKFFGLPDGAYLYTDILLNDDFDLDISYNRFEHLLGRIDVGAESFYSRFRANDDVLSNQAIKQMSNLTKRLLASIDYAGIAQKRKENFKQIHKFLKGSNKLTLEIADTAVPMVYPYLVENGSKLKQKLIENKIYVATYWPNVLEWSDRMSLEYSLTENLVLFPIDQRYGKDDFEHIIKCINE